MLRRLTIGTNRSDSLAHFGIQSMFVGNSRTKDRHLYDGVGTGELLTSVAYTTACPPANRILMNTQRPEA